MDIMKQSTPESNDEFLRPFKRIREVQPTPVSAKQCNARGTPITSSIEISAQCSQFTTRKGKRNIIEAEHSELIRFPKPRVQCQKEQYGVPMQQTEEPLGSGIEGLDRQAENAVKRTRGGLWQCQETMDLLKIRLEMEPTLLNATLKGPLWEDVSRKLAEKGYTRSAKNCMEKFKNIRKYYNRTKKSQAGSEDGKSHCFFSWLKAFHNSASATKINYAATSKPNSAPTPVSIGIGMASSSERTQAPSSYNGTEAASPVSSRRPPRLSAKFKEVGGEEAYHSVPVRKRWQDQETMALLNIRSEMDAFFCYPTATCSPWKEVSRKLVQQGYIRSAQNCKVKFKNLRRNYKHSKEGRAGHQDRKSSHFFSKLEGLSSTIGATTATMATTSTPNLTPTPVSIRIKMVGSSGSIRTPPNSVMPAIITTAAATQAGVSKFSFTNSNVKLPIGVPASAAADDVNLVPTDCRQNVLPSTQKHQSLSLSLRKFNPPINGDAANKNLTDHTQLLSLTVEKRVEANGDNLLMPNRAITPTHRSMKSLKHLQSSNEVKSSLSLEAREDERALQSNVTTNPYSSPIQQDQRQVHVEEDSLPFVKCAHSMWGIFESMKVFQLMPQYPHFRPLGEENEVLREGIAIGHMLNFANLVENICKLHIEDPKNRLENMLKALTDLEELGFAVQSIRSQLEELLRIKDIYSQSNYNLKSAEEELVVRKCQLDEKQESINRLNMQLQELLMEMVRKCCNIAELQRKVDSTKERLHAVASDFARTLR
ncbi:hypothetical protein AQUCO_02200261v1 [Aquilegia coerulea]|uniref:Myb-like domain-containing protein n=1 Tax=Aquilegia coerulea TaxID=218851 RepID=A0A2G5DDW4_AQUCA|nr:hypothetical protein AQUCO_02200261v1 [Aquilegia coerulea]